MASSRSKSDAENSAEKIMCTNLNLLGFTFDDGSRLSPLVFEHANPSAFQQVFYFLLNLIEAEQSKLEFRDCWPILDKKQESEFRRKVANWLKELQRENSTDLPYTNPSLFQSPGGRKFVQFLAVFSSFVLKRCLQREQQHVGATELILSKPAIMRNSSDSNSKELRQLMFRHLVKLNAQSTRAAAWHQMSLQLVTESTEVSAAHLSTDYFRQKAALVESRSRVKTLDSKIVEKFKEDSGCAEEVDVETVRGKCADRYDKLMARLTGLENGLGRQTAAADSILYVMDDTIAKPRLQLSAEETSKGNGWLDPNDLQLSYENLLVRRQTLAQQAVAIGLAKPQAYPLQSFEENGAMMKRSEISLAQLKTSLEELHRNLKENVGILEARSMKVDWANCELAPKAWRNKTVDGSTAGAAGDQLLLLPPTPIPAPLSSQGPDGSGGGGGATPDIISKLRLLTPTHLRKMRGKEEQEQRTPVRPASLGAVQGSAMLGQQLEDTPLSSAATTGLTRRFPRKITPDQSPLLRASLLQSALRTSAATSAAAATTSASMHSLYDSISTTLASADELRASESKNSLECFSPVMCSTMQLCKEDLRCIMGHDETAATVSPPLSPLFSPPPAARTAVAPSGIAHQQLLVPSSAAASAGPTEHQSLPEVEETKIQRYRRILAAMQNRQAAVVTGENDETSSGNQLLAAWGQAAVHLSPRTSPAAAVRRQDVGSRGTTTPGAACDIDPSPAGLLSVPRLSAVLEKLSLQDQYSSTLCEETLEAGNLLMQDPEVERTVKARIDRLIDSLTLSDSGHEITLEGLSFNEDLLLSPHVP